MAAYVFIKIIYYSQFFLFHVFSQSPVWLLPVEAFQEVDLPFVLLCVTKLEPQLRRTKKPSLLALFFFSPREVTFSWILPCPSSCFPPVALFAETNLVVNDKWQQALSLCTCIPNTLINKIHSNLWYHLCMQYIWLFLILSIFLNWLEINMQPWRPKASEVKGTQCSNVYNGVNCVSLPGWKRLTKMFQHCCFLSQSGIETWQQVKMGKIVPRNISGMCLLLGRLELG